MAAQLALVPNLGNDDEGTGTGALTQASTAAHSAGSSPRPWTASLDTQVGRVVGGRYRLEALIAQGGMGRIYRATQLALGRQVAVKILQAQGTLASQRLATQRFVFEAAAAARMHHPNSVTVLDYGTDNDGTAYLVMELLQGRTLGQLLRHEGRLAVYRALAIAKQTAAALCAAHAHDIVHRDLKPGNLFVSTSPHAARGAEGEDFIKVVDFGLAKAASGNDEGLTVTGRFLGTPGYMAPEQIRGESTDHRCDIYALGAILFEMLTGSPAYLRENVYETMVAQVHEPVPPLRLVGGLGPRPLTYATALEALVRRAMAKAPEDRFASMKEMHDALGALFARDDLGQRRPAAEVLGEGAPQSCAPTVHALAYGRGDTWVEAPLRRAMGPKKAHYGPPPAAWTFQHAPRPDKPLGSATGTSGLWWRLGALMLAVVQPLLHRPHVRLFAAVALFICLSIPAMGGTARRLRAARAPVVTHLDSMPRGASVWLGQQQLCLATPCVVPLRRPWLKRHVSLRFVHPDCEEFVATRKLEHDQLQVHAMLTAPVPHS